MVNVESSHGLTQQPQPLNQSKTRKHSNTSNLRKEFSFK